MIFNFDMGFDRSLDFECDRAVVAISANIVEELSTLHFAYSQAVVEAGGAPTILPANCDASAIRSLVGSVDALLLSGGDDIDARYFGEENLEGLTSLNEQRDFYEFMLMRAALDCGIPIFGICRGCQVVNVALGGSIYQDLPSQYEGQLLNHKILTNKEQPVHDIEVEEGSVLCNVLGSSALGVNSRHHQSIKDVAPGLRATAHSADGVVEGVEGYVGSYILALQSHPENMECGEMKRLFRHIVEEAKLYRAARRIHQLNPIVDSHCDTPMLYDEGGFDFARRNHNAKVDLVKMAEGGLDATITVAYIPQSTPQAEATERALSILRRFRGDIEPLRGRVSIGTIPTDVTSAKARGERTILLGLENGWALGGDISNVDRFKEEGVVYVTLCHNGSNDLCDSAVGESLHGGVSPLGEAVILRMNELGVTVDVSHSSEQSTLDAVRISRRPIIASHSSCKALCDHPRNLSDDAIRAICGAGGVVQICGYGGFLKRGGEVTIQDLVNHIEYAVGLVGYDGVGVGSDFDGGGGVLGFDGANNFVNVTVELLRRGHSSENIAKIMGGNILRVLHHNMVK